VSKLAAHTPSDRVAALDTFLSLLEGGSHDAAGAIAAVLGAEQHEHA
jgi:hypothetical protein